MGASTHTTVGFLSFLFSGIRLGLIWFFLGGEREGRGGKGGLYRIDFGVSGLL